MNGLPFAIVEQRAAGSKSTTLPPTGARGVAETVAGRAEELDARITEAAQGWTADRLGTVERSALRVAVHELQTGEVPAEVAINEAVAFTKRYASEDGARLVNGILGKIQREEAA